jgi:exodeoxyribonuclease III
MMKIATFNIKNVRRRLPNLLNWLAEANPNVVCLQELKATDAEFPAEAIKKAGYEAIWRGQKTWNGVAILSKWKPIETLSKLPGDPTDTQSRYIEAAVNGIIVASLYAPNGNPQPGPKFDYKLAWLRRLSTYAADLLAAGVLVVLAGDYNVVPTDRDIYPSKSWDKDALVQPESRAAFAALTKQGWVDAVRAIHPTEPMYTFWLPAQPARLPASATASAMWRSRSLTRRPTRSVHFSELLGQDAGTPVDVVKMIPASSHDSWLRIALLQKLAG